MSTALAFLTLCRLPEFSASGKKSVPVKEAYEEEEEDEEEEGEGDEEVVKGSVVFLS